MIFEFDSASTRRRRAVNEKNLNSAGPVLSETFGQFEIELIAAENGTKEDTKGKRSDMGFPRYLHYIFKILKVVRKKSHRAYLLSSHFTNFYPISKISKVLKSLDPSPS